MDVRAGIINPHANNILTELRSKVRKIVKNAKQDYYHKMLEKLDSKNIFQAVKWSSSIRLYTALLIQQQDGTLAIDILSKQKALEEQLLTPTTTTASNTDNKIDLSQETRDDVVLWHLCTMQEMEADIILAGNTASGLDEILPTIIKKAWPVYCEEITSLFQQC